MSEPGMLWTMVLPYSAMLRYIGVQCYTWLTVVLRLSDNQLYSRRMVWQGQSNQHYTTPLNSFPPLPLHYTPLTHPVNLGWQTVQLPAYHRIHSHRSIMATYWARKPWWTIRAGVPKKPTPHKTEWNGPEQKWVENVQQVFWHNVRRNTLHLPTITPLFLSLSLLTAIFQANLG